MDSEGVCIAHMEAAAERDGLAGTLNGGAGDGEDVYVQNRLLEARLDADESERTRLEEENKLLRNNVRSRDRRIATYSAKVQNLEGSVEQLRRQLDDRDAMIRTHKGDRHGLLDQVDQLTAQNIRLRGELEVAHANSIPGGIERLQRLPLKDRFAETMRDKVSIVTLRRKLRELRARYQEVFESSERAAMEAEDQRSFFAAHVREGTSLGSELRRASVSGVAEDTTKSTDDGSDDDVQAFRGGLVRVDAQRAFTSGLSFNRGFEGIAVRLDLDFPMDCYHKAKMGTSAFATVLADVDLEVQRHLRMAKDEHDKHQSALLNVFNEGRKGGRCLFKNPKEMYMARAQEALKVFNNAAMGVMRRLREGLVDIVKREARVKEEWLLEQRPPRVDCSVQAMVGDVEDPRIASLQDSVEYLKERVQQVQKEHVRKARELEAARDKANINARFLRQKIVDIHEGVLEALTVVHRHRFAWISAVPNTFAEVIQNSKKLQEDTVQYNVAVGAAVEKERALLRKFSHYFLSSESFGVNQGGVREEHLKEYARTTRDRIAKSKASEGRQKTIDTMKQHLTLELKEEQKLTRAHSKTGGMARRRTGSNASTPRNASLPASLQATPSTTPLAAPLSFPEFTSVRSETLEALEQVPSAPPTPLKTQSPSVSNARLSVVGEQNHRAKKTVAVAVDPKAHTVSAAATVSPRSSGPTTPRGVPLHHAKSFSGMPRDDPLRDADGENGCDGSGEGEGSAPRLSRTHSAVVFRPHAAPDAKPSTAAPNRRRYSTTTAAPSQEYTRMEAWQRLQAEQWESKRQAYVHEARSQQLGTFVLSDDAPLAPAIVPMSAPNAAGPMSLPSIGGVVPLQGPTVPRTASLSGRRR